MTEQRDPAISSEKPEEGQPAVGRPEDETRDPPEPNISNCSGLVTNLKDTAAQPGVNLEIAETPVMGEVELPIVTRHDEPAEPGADSGFILAPSGQDQSANAPQVLEEPATEYDLRRSILETERDQALSRLQKAREKEREYRALAESELALRGEAQKALKRSQRQMRKRETLLEEASGEIQRLKEAASRLRQRHNVFKRSLAEMESALATESRLVTSLKRSVGQLTKKCDVYVHLDPVLDWVGRGLGLDSDFLPRLLATTGADPYPAREFDGHLVSKGFELIWPGNGEENEQVEVMIVGRTGWTEEQLEKQVAAREGQTLMVYSQEMFLLSLAVSRDLLSELGPAELKAIAGDHPALNFLADGELEWPNRVVPMLPQEFRPFDSDGRAEASPLHIMGYAVGKTHGRPGAERRRLLSKAFEREIPWVESEQYMQDWGKPRTRRRLWRIANHLAWLARSWKRLPSHRVAVNDWVDDLAHLKRQHFRPWMRFKWPEVRVPAE